MIKEAISNLRHVGEIFPIIITEMLLGNRGAPKQPLRCVAYVRDFLGILVKMRRSDATMDTAKSHADPVRFCNTHRNAEVF